MNDKAKRFEAIKRLTKTDQDLDTFERLNGPIENFSYQGRDEGGRLIVLSPVNEPARVLL